MNTVREWNVLQMGSERSDSCQSMQLSQRERLLQLSICLRFLFFQLRVSQKQNFAHLDKMTYALQMGFGNVTLIFAYRECY